MTYAVGRGVRVEIQKAIGTQKAVTGVTQANPAVATSPAHGFANGQVGFFKDVTGMVQLDQQAVRLKNVTANTFECEDINSSDWAAFTAGNFTPISQWSTIAPAASYEIGGGASDSLDVSVLLDDIKQEEQGQLAAQTVSFDVRTETISGEAMGIVRDAARRSLARNVRVTLKDGNLRNFRGTPSLPGEKLDQGAVGSGSFAFTVSGFVTEGAAL